MQILVPLNLGGNEIRNVLLQVLATDPTALGNGHIYYNSTLHKVRVRENGSWVSLGEGASADWTTLTNRPSHLTGTINTANQVVVLDSGGKLPEATIPAIAITEYLGTSANQGAMLALTGQLGDWTIRTDEGKVYIITGSDPSDIGDWTALEYPVPDDPDWDDVQNKPTTFAPRKHSQTIGNNSSTTLAVTHNFDTKDVVVSVRTVADDEQVVCDIEHTDVDTVNLAFTVAPATNSIRVVVIG